MMEPRQWATIDKSEWGPGPWQSEPDKMQWTDDATGLPCLIVRNSVGSLCGYVGVTEANPLFERALSDDGLPELEVHGGITFAGFCSPHATEAEGICHVTEDDAPVWWLGFDCAHGFDVSPKLVADMQRYYPARIQNELPTPFREVYRDVAYVKTECASLAAQLARKPE